MAVIGSLAEYLQWVVFCLSQLYYLNVRSWPLAVCHDPGHADF